MFLYMRSRRNPLFLAGAAAFLVLGRSMFIDISASLGVPGLWPANMGDVLFAVVAVGWLYARDRRPVPRVRLSVWWFVLGAFFALFIAMELALSVANASGLDSGTPFEARYWFYIPCGFLVSLDVLRRFTLVEVDEYIRVLSILTTCLAVLYIASALNVPVYPYEKNYTYVVGGTTIIRDFGTVPTWLILAWGYFLSRSQKNGWTFVALLVLACAEFLTYTRSSVVMFAVSGVLVAGLMVLRRGRRRRGAVLVASGAVVAVLALGLLPAVLPAQFEFFQSRIRGLVGLQSILAAPNFAYRFTGFETARRAGALADPYLGAGMFEASQVMNSADSDIQRVVYRTGLVGVAVFAAPIVGALLVAIGRIGRRSLDISAESLLLTGVVVTLPFVFSFFGVGYLQWPPLSLFPVALIAYATGFPALAAAAPTRSLESRAGSGEPATGL